VRRETIIDSMELFRSPIITFRLYSHLRQNCSPWYRY